MIESGGPQEQASATAQYEGDGWDTLVQTVTSRGVEFQRKFPDFFIVGHPKCGTTALFQMLRSHPQIHMPAKEPRFFLRQRIEPDRQDPREPLRPPSSKVKSRPGWRPRSLEGYLALFSEARPGQLVGEATPDYLRSPLTAGRIAAVRPDARIIMVLREPASFLRSFHLQLVRGYNETQRDLRNALALEDQRREGRAMPTAYLSQASPKDLQYLELVRYVDQLKRYHAVFPRERVLVLIYEEFRRDNTATVRTILRFLNVDDTPPIETVETTPSSDLRLEKLHVLVNLRRKALRDRKSLRRLSDTFEKITPPRLRGTLRARWRRAAYSEPTPPDERLMSDLRRRFKPEVEALSDYLGRDLVSLWGYDRIA
jgi:hypothetical protein